MSSLVKHISKILSFAWKTWIYTLYNFLESCLLSSLCNSFSYLHKRSRNIHILKRQFVIIGIHCFWKLNFLFFLNCNTKRKNEKIQNIKLYQRIIWRKIYIIIYNYYFLITLPVFYYGFMIKNTSFWQGNINLQIQQIASKQFKFSKLESLLNVLNVLFIINNDY